MSGPAPTPTDGTGSMDANASRASVPRASRLASLGVIRAQGLDAASFLHGQLTQDVTSMTAGEARLAGYCSAKGRLLASFVMLRPSAEEVLLVCSADLLAPTLKRLSMFVLRAKCRLSDATAELPVWGVSGGAPPGIDCPDAAWSVRATASAAPLEPGGTALPPAPGWVIRMPAGDDLVRLMVIGSGGQRPPALEGLVETPEADWAWGDVQAGLPRITASTIEQFVPQMVNLELIGGVNFQKGCYPGQEIVARSQYRGTLKRRMALFVMDAAAAAGGELFHDSDPGQPSGLVVNAAERSGATVLLAEVKLAALASSGQWHLGTPDGPPLQRRALPYAWPVDGDGASAAA